MSSHLHKCTPHCKTQWKVVKLQLKKISGTRLQLSVMNHWSTKCAVVKEGKLCCLHWAKVCKYHSPETEQGTAASHCAGDRIKIISCLRRSTGQERCRQWGKREIRAAVQIHWTRGLRKKLADNGLWKLLECSIPAINLGSSSLHAADRPCPTSCWSFPQTSTGVPREVINLNWGFCFPVKWGHGWKEASLEELQVWFHYF